MKQNKYSDIVSLPHPVSVTHPRMSRHDRAAQFAPFAAVVGHEEAAAETARLTDRRVELDESELERLERKWQWFCAHAPERPSVTITYFQKDKQKDGGAYCTAVGVVDKIDSAKGRITLSQGQTIPLADIVDLVVDLVGFDDLF